MLIRERTDRDLARLEEILHTTHQRDGYPLRAENTTASWLTRHSGAAWVLVRDDVVVGHVALDRGPADDGVEIVRYFVAPDARGTGAASMLLQHVLGRARLAGHDAWLVVMPHNKAAIAAYERAGFVPDGEDGWTDPEGTWHAVDRYRFAAPAG